MFDPIRLTIVPIAAAAFLFTGCSEAPPMPEVERTAGTPIRPADPAANLPSDTGSQTTLPSGAVTGAGQPQGTGVQPDVGAPGGVERRARAEERTSTAASPEATAPATAEAPVGATESPAARGEAPAARREAPAAAGESPRAEPPLVRQSRG